MDVAVSSLRADLASWIDRVRSGEDVVVTDRGIPVARLTALDGTPLIEQLTKRGVLSSPRRSLRPVAAHTRRVLAKGSVADLVAEQRR